MDNETLDLEKQGNKFANWLKKNIIAIFLTILSIYFVFSGAIKFTMNDMNWWEKLCFIATTMIFGIVISTLVAEGGYKTGKQDESFIATRQQAIKLCEETIEDKEIADLFVSKKIDKDIYSDRHNVLSKAGIKYCEIFDENGVVKYIPNRDKGNYTHEQRNAIKKAINIKKIEFTLYGFTSVKLVGRKIAPNEVRRRAKKISSDFVVRSFIAIISGSVMFAWVGVSLSSVIYSFFQLMIWFGSGLISRIGNYNFIVNDMREYDQERIWYLKEFQALPNEEKEKLREELNGGKNNG